MKKVVIVGLILANASAFAAQRSAGQALVESAVLVTFSPLLTAGTVTKIVVGTSVLVMDETSGGIRKEVVLAAVEDAALFKSTNGDIEKSSLLADAMNELSKFEGADGLSDVEKAEAIMILGSSFQE